jgi:hypothetical protein
MSYEQASTMHEDGSITLPPNPWRTSATWADYNWRGMADELPEWAQRVFGLIADAVEEGR